MVLKYTSAVDLINGKEISIDRLITLKSDDETLKNLGCPICRCPLILKHLGSMRGPYLSTKPGFHHSEECDKRVKVELRKERFEAIAHDDIYLTPEAQHARASNFARRLRRVENGKAIKPKKSVRKKLSKTKRIGKNTKTVKGVVHRASINPSVGRTIRNEHVRLSAATPSNVDRYISRTIKFGGMLDEIKIGNASASIVVSYGRNKTSIILNEAFFRQSATGYKNLLIALKRFIEVNSKNPIVAAVVDVIPNKNNEPECLVRIDQALCFEGLSLGMYLYRNKVIKI
ncbi:hypothetical protein [Limosilactobacillus vaginalis]|uniref:hypothetical protein n=1 Tax=Limosilactobacillus vaginalis TaxID=1633 RepID=UPI001F09CCC0|nr:hypothetical protein [Limosilactobacillus vaginalis]